jgi:hypothetical protein
VWLNFLGAAGTVRGTQHVLCAHNCRQYLHCKLLVHEFTKPGVLLLATSSECMHGVQQSRSQPGCTAASYSL